MVGDLSLLASASPVHLAPAKDLHGVLPFPPKIRPTQQHLLEGAYQAQQPVQHMMAVPGLATQASAAAAAAYQAFDRASLIDVQGSRFLLTIEPVLAVLAPSCEFDAASSCICLV
jgi:hypothetical protein